MPEHHLHPLNHKYEQVTKQLAQVPGQSASKYFQHGSPDSPQHEKSPHQPTFYEVLGDYKIVEGLSEHKKFG